MPHSFIIFDRVKDQNGSRLEIAGFTTRDIAHTFGVPHAAVQVAIMIQKEKDGVLLPHVLIHRRSRHKKVDPLKWDICGGHLDADDHLLPKDKPFSFVNLPARWKDPQFVEQLFWEAAIREANEEVHFIKSEFSFSKKHLRCIGEVGTFSTGLDQPLAINREYSSFFLAEVPEGVIQLSENDNLQDFLYMEDTVGIGGQTIDMKIEALQLLTFEELFKDYRLEPGKFADGIARVLKRLEKEPGLL